MKTRAVTEHVRRYPWWYGVAAIWLAAIIALPIVELDPLEAFARDDVPTTSAPGSEDLVDGIPGGPFGSGGSLGEGDRAGGSSGTAAPDAADGTGAPDDPVGLELVPPELLDLIFDAIPTFQFPPLPAELATLARAMAPIAAYGCSGLGLASIVIAVVAQTIEGVPLERVLPYLAPVSAACATFPIPEARTVCTVDEPFVVDIGGLTNSPPILGLGIDQLDVIESTIAATFGQEIPRLAPQLRAQLGCTFVS
jgi:hypothetical protein